MSQLVSPWFSRTIVPVLLLLQLRSMHSTPGGPGGAAVMHLVHLMLALFCAVFRCSFLAWPGYSL